MLGDKLEEEEESKKSQRRENEDKACDGRTKEEQREVFSYQFITFTCHLIVFSEPSCFESWKIDQDHESQIHFEDKE